MTSILGNLVFFRTFAEVLETVKYPIGQQSFEVLREDGNLYVDKTRFIEALVNSGSRYFFLARPRRFGKSLFLSTLKCFFEGRRELFKGLYIDGAEVDWQPRPVFRLDLNMNRYEERGELDAVLDSYFREWERKYCIAQVSSDPNVRFKEIVEGAHLKTGRKAVILVDEYDKPLVGNLNRQDNFGHYRDRLASFYGNFKSCADHIRMVFLTGVSRFSKLTIFSGLNNLDDITFSHQYSDICGITGAELHVNFRIGIDALAAKRGIPREMVTALLKENYDGYRFAEDGSGIYNPWSLLKAMKEQRIANFWNETGLPTIIAESLKRMKVDLPRFFQSKCTEGELTGLDLENPRPLPLLYQTGYLTIKEYDFKSGRYTLGIPNREVKAGLMDVLLPYYANLHDKSAEAYVWTFVDYLESGDADSFMRELQAFFSGISYELEMDSERNFQNALFIFTSLLGLKTNAEVRTSDGRIDLTVETDKYFYIIELKFGGSAHQALSQIERKQYALPYLSLGKKIMAVGANFNPDTRRMDDWLIKEITDCR